MHSSTTTPPAAPLPHPHPSRVVPRPLPRALRASAALATAAALAAPLAAAPLTLAAAPLTLAGDQDHPADGFQLQPLAADPPLNPTGIGTLVGAVATLSTGEVVTFDGERVDKLAADGSLLQNLATLPEPVYPACFAVDPTETFVLFGESSTGAVRRAALDGSGWTSLATLPFNYDVAFESPTSALVSANLSGGFADTQIVRLDVATGAWTTVASVDGPSGPLVLDELGNLYYGLQSVPVAVVAWTAAQLAGGPVLDESDALTLASGFVGATDLAWDAEAKALYLAENDFTGTVNRVVRVGASAAASEPLVDARDGAYVYSLEVDPGDAGPLLLPYQPEDGGTLRYLVTDFFSYADRVAVTPARPAVDLSGPGTTGLGTIHYGLSGGPPGGSFQAFYGPSSLFAATEPAYLVPGLPPLVTGLDLATLVALPGLHPLDGTGAGTFDVPNGSGATGVIATQALVLDALGQVVGVSAPAFL